MHVPVLLFSGGEPLVREDFFEIAAYAASRGLNTAISTNGTVIRNDTVRSLIDSGILYAGISVDSADPGLHDRFRGLPGSHEKAIQALEYCVGSGLKCGIRMTVTCENYHEVGALIETGLAIGVPRFCLYWLVPSGRGKNLGNNRQLTPQQVRNVLDVLFDYARDTEPETMELLSVDAPQDALYVLHRMKNEGINEEYAMKMIQHLAPGCSAGINVLNIDAHGNLYPCQFAQRNEFFLGNVRESGVRRIWTETMPGCRQRFRFLPAEVPECRDCTIKTFCGGGCAIRAKENARMAVPADPLTCQKSGYLD